MAEDKNDNAGRELMDMDFLSDAQSEVNRMSTAGLYDKLAQFGKQEAQQPLIADATRRQLWKPISTMVKKAETQVQLGMAAYIMANPEIDESKVFDGTEGQLESLTTESSARFKELNRQLAYMTPTHPDYAEVANEINSINKNLVQLRDDNSKLLNVRNGIKDMDTEEMSSGQTPGEVMMYNDILVGNKENFKTIDGKLHWVDPTLDDDDPMKNTAVSDINAGGPTMTNDAAFDDHNTLMNTMRTTPAADLNDRDVDYQVNKMFKGMGNDGVKSLIFDSQGEEVSMYDTDEWFQSWYDANGITTSEGQTAEMNRIKKDGVLSTGTFDGGEDGSGDMTNTSVKKHFAKWYAERLKETPKTGNGKPAPKTDLNNFPAGDGSSDGSDIDKPNSTTKNVVENPEGFDGQFDLIAKNSNGSEEVFVPTIIEKMPWLKGKVVEDFPGGDYAKLLNDPLFEAIGPKASNSSFRKLYNKQVQFSRQAYSFNLKDPSEIARMKMTLKVYTNVQNGIYPAGLNMGENEGSLNLTKEKAFQKIILAQLEGNKDFSDYENWI